MATFETLLYADNLAQGTDKINANFAQLLNSPQNGYGVASVAILPSLPDPAYPDGCLVFLTADGKLYKNFEGVWQPVVAAVDLEGQIVASQIKDGALNIAKFAANLKPPVVVEALPDLPDPSYGADSLVVYDGKLYRNESDEWVAVVNTADLEGQITTGQIAENAITATQISDGAISTPKLAANAVTAAKIEANAVTTDKLAANSVTAGKIAALSVNADHLTANSVTTAKIEAGAVGTDQLAANSVTAAKMRIGSSQNMIVNSEWLDGVTAPWTKSGSANFAAATAGMPGVRCVSITANGVNYHSVASNKFEVSAGEIYYLQSDVTVVGASAYTEMLLQCFDKDDVAFSWPTAWSHSGTVSSYQKISGHVTIPSGTRTAQFVYQMTPASVSGSYTYMLNPRVLRAGEGRLIVDGAITATKIAAGAIGTDKLDALAVTADKIAANAITAGKIAANAVETEHLASKSVTAAKMVLSDTSNLALNPAFAGGDSGGWSLPSGNTTIYQSTAGVAAIKYYGRITTGTSNRDFYNGEYFPVTPGETYYMSMWVYRASSNGTFRAGINLQAADGSANGWHTAFTAPANLTNNTWTQFEGYVTVPSGKYFGRLWGGAVSNASPAGYWNFTNLIVRKAADTRLLVDGAIELTNADKTSAALSVKNSSGTEVLRLGNITSKAGVPSGTQFGLWGALGTGVFIQDAPRIIAAGSFDSTRSSISVPANSQVTTSLSALWTIFNSSFTVPSGKRWMVLLTPDYGVTLRSVSSVVLEHIWAQVSVSNVLAPGTYSNLKVDLWYKLRNVTATSISTGAHAVICSYIVLEIDA